MVYHDLNKSTYKFMYDDLVFVFSSKLYRDKFKRMYINFVKDETLKMQIKYKCNIFCDMILLILLYKKIEKRGFRVLYKGKELEQEYYVLCIISDEK